MIRIHAKEGLLGEGKIHHLDSIPTGITFTGRRALAAARLDVPSFSRRELAVAVNGRRLGPRELDLPIPDGAEVLVASPQHGPEFLVLVEQALVAAVIGAAINFVVSLLLPRPKPPGVPQDRGDDSSATYAWDGIQTAYGQGQPIGFGYGRHTLGGQVISEAVTVEDQAETLNVLLALCDGPIWRIGDALAAERDRSPFVPTPGQITVNDSVYAGAFAMRPGSNDQAPLRDAQWLTPATTLAVNADLPHEFNAGTFLMLGDEEVGRVSFLINFPGGLYRYDPQGNKLPLTWPWKAFWRYPDDNFWRLLGQSDRQTGVPFAPIHVELMVDPGGSLQYSFDLPAGTTLPIEVRFAREYRNPLFPLAGQLVEDGVWRQLVQYAPNQFSYPAVALAALSVQASSIAYGSRPQIKIRCDLDLVRVWDESTGWSDPCWEVPPAPFNWMQHPPGRNPAWQALRFCLDEEKGLGRWLTDENLDVDLPAIRRWSILCDNDPNPSDPWGEPAFCCDIFFDAPRPAWERLLAICSAGRCTPILVGRKVTFVYQFRDAHSDSLVSVPAKTPVQLFTSTNVQDLRVTWLQRRGRSTVIQYQFLNEAKQHAQDVLTVEDPEGNANDDTNPLADAWQPEVTQVFGVTRESQLLREGVFTHRLQRLVTHKITFLTGPWSLASVVGDLIWVENEVLRPFAADVAMSCVAESGQASSTTLTVSHVVTGTGLRVVYRDPDGAPQTSDVVSLTALAGGRTEIEIADAGSWIAGAPVVVGKVAKLTKPYLVAGLGLTQGVLREVLAIEWQPAMFDPIGPDFFSEPPLAPLGPTFGSTGTLDVAIEAMRTGGHLLSWSGTGGTIGRRTRVWARLQDLDAWILLGESTTGNLETRSLSALQDYQVAICRDAGGGAFPEPQEENTVGLTAPEFPRFAMPPVRRLTIEQQAGGLVFRWPAQGQWDLHYYEVRAGSTWVTGRPIYRGQLEEVFVAQPPRAGTFMVAARSLNGLYSEPAIAAPPATWEPSGKVAYAESDELVTTPPGTLDGLDYDPGDKVLRFDADDTFDGSYTSAEVDGGFVAPWDWQVDLDYTLVDAGTCGEETGTCGDGEAIWATCACRPPSPARPGLAVDDGLIGSDLGLCGDDSPFETVSGGVGEVGAIAAVVLESRYHDGDTWSDWSAHVDGPVVSQKLQVRTRIARASQQLALEVHTLATKGFL